MRWRRHGERGDRIAALQAEQEQLRQRLDAFVALCVQAGVDVRSAAADAVGGVPPGLIAAARAVRSPGGEPVMLEFPGPLPVLAVVTAAGDPEHWWPEIARISTGLRPERPGVVSLQHSRLAVGLSAVAVPEEGTVAITVSRVLDPAGQRAAVRTAMRAARRAGWVPSRVPGWLILPVIFRRHGMAIVSGKVHAAIAGAGLLTAGAVAASVLVVSPAAPGSVRVLPPGPSARAAAALHRHRRRPVKVRTVTSRQSRAGTPASQPSPQVLPAQRPSPPPSGSPPAGQSSSPAPVVSATVGDPTCIWVLGLKVCV